MSDTSLTGYRLATHFVRTVHPFLDGTVPDMVSDRVSRLYLDSLRCFLSSKPFVDSPLIHLLCLLSIALLLRFIKLYFNFSTKRVKLLLTSSVNLYPTDLFDVNSDPVHALSVQLHEDSSMSCSEVYQEPD